MEIFHKAKASKSAVRLKSYHNKFLLPEEDGDAAVKQHGNGATAAARWSVEIVDGTLVRLKSVKTNMYLSASDDSFQVGLTGKRVIQAFNQTDSVEWAPVKEGNGRLMLKTRAAGTFLCANGSFPPWRNAVTHDMLCATANVDWAIWVVDIVDKDSGAAGNGGPASSVMRRTCSVPANSVDGSGGGGGNGSPPPAGSVRSVRTMSPRRQALDSIRRSSSTSNKNTKSSTSFNNHEPIIDGNKPLPPEVRMAKKTFLEVQDIDFKTVFYSERLKNLETSISALLSYNMINNDDNYTRLTTNSKLLTLRDQLQTLKLNRKRDMNELNEYEAFKERKANMKAELQREVMKARELQCRETELGAVLEEARGKRAELMRELEMVERKIKMGEEEEVKNEKEMDELYRVIGWRSEGVKGMEREESVWVKRKVMAERTIKEVEDHWAVIKDSF